MNSVQQQGERQHWKVLIESFHLNGHTFRFDSSFHLMWLTLTLSLPKVNLTKPRKLLRQEGSYN